MGQSRPFRRWLDLSRVGKAPRLLFTGGASASAPFLLVSVPKESTTFKEAVSLGVLTASMVSTPSVMNMAEEEVLIRRLLPARQSRVMLVASAFHMRRSQRLFVS